MIPFNKYIGEYLVIVTKPVCNPDELSGIRSSAKVFKYKDQYLLVRDLRTEDLKDEDFVPWLESMWGHAEANLKHFLRYRKPHSCQK